MTTRAVLFDLGNTLVDYYTSAEFPGVLQRCLRECAEAQGLPEDCARERETYTRALLLNKEQSDYAVRPLIGRLERLFDATASPDALVAAFLKPIFSMARLNPHALFVLEKPSVRDRERQRLVEVAGLRSRFAAPGAGHAMPFLARLLAELVLQDSRRQDRLLPQQQLAHLPGQPFYRRHSTIGHGRATPCLRKGCGEPPRRRIALRRR